MGADVDDNNRALSAAERVDGETKDTAYFATKPKSYTRYNTGREESSG